MYFKRLILFFAILTLFGCAKQMLENESPLRYQGNDKFLQQISQQALELDKKLNFSNKLISEGEVNWDSVLVRINPATPNSTIILVPYTQQNKEKPKFVQFKTENSKLIEAPSLLTDSRTSTATSIEIKKTVLPKALQNNRKKKSDGSRTIMSTTLCRVELNPQVTHRPSSNWNGVVDPGFWDQMAIDIQIVLNNLGAQATATYQHNVGIVVMTDAIGIMHLLDPSFYERYRVGYNYLWVNVQHIEHANEPQIDCGDNGGGGNGGDDGGGGGGTGPGTPPDDDNDYIDWGIPTDEDLETELDGNEENLNGEMYTDKRYVWKFHRSYNEGFWLNSYEKARVKRSSANNPWLFVSFTHLTQQPVGMVVGREIEIVMIDNTVEMTSTRAKVSLWYKIHRIGSGFGTTLPYYSSDFYKSKEFQPNQ